MKWIDLSRELTSGMPVFPGDPEVRTETLRTVSRDLYHMDLMMTCMHAGTHLDAPKHFLENGSDVAAIPLDRTAGWANRIQAAPRDGIIRTADLRLAYGNLKERHSRILISCGWDERWGTTDFFDGFFGFEPDFGAFLTESGIVLVGLDFPSVKYGVSDHVSAHRDLLGRNIVILESLVGLNRLPEVFLLVAMPLKFRGMDGSLVRAAAAVPDEGETLGNSV